MLGGVRRSALDTGGNDASLYHFHKSHCETLPIDTDRHGDLTKMVASIEDICWLQWEIKVLRARYFIVYHMCPAL